MSVPDKPPIHVRVTDDQPPLDVNVVNEEERDPDEPTESELAARGRAEERVTVAESQRVVNLMWESTQRLIALWIVFITIGVAAGRSVYDMASGSTPTGPAFIFLVGAANLVIGFYFGRTNHTRTGGTGDRPEGAR